MKKYVRCLNSINFTGFGWGEENKELVWNFIYPVVSEGTTHYRIINHQNKEFSYVKTRFIEV
jgi:hypothetical protein